MAGYSTKLDLATRVLREMQRVPFGESPNAEDVAVIYEKYDTKLEEWRDRSVAYWENTGSTVSEIPTSVIEPLVALMVNATEHQFGRNPKTVEQRQAIEERLLRWLRRHTTVKSKRKPVMVDYF